jgi:hypothetical protein
MYRPFTGKKSPTRLARAALFPMMAGFRWMLDDKTDQPVAWRGGFSNVLKVLGALRRRTDEGDAKRQRRRWLQGKHASRPFR